MPADSAEKPLDTRYAPTSWSGTTNIFYDEDVEVPSGQLCRARRPGIQGLIAAGVIDQMDSLTGIVSNKHINRAKGVPEVDPRSLLNDPQALQSVLEVADKITLHIVVAPRIHETPPCKVCRSGYLDHLFTPKEHEFTFDTDPGTPVDTIWVHNIDAMDKMFLMNYAVGGSRDLDRFRGESQAALADVPDGEALENTSK